MGVKKMANQREMFNLGKRLPPLSCSKVIDRTEIEDDDNVKNLINSKMLLNKELKEILFSILKYTKQLNDLIEVVTKDKMVPYSIYNLIRKKRRELPLDFFRLLRYRRWGGEIRKLSARNRELILKAEKIVNTTLLKQIKSRSDKIQNLLSDFEDKHRITLSILHSQTIFICPNCSRVLSIGKFKKVTCRCGKKITDIQKIKEVSVFKFNDSMRTFIGQGMWLEHGIDYLWKRKNLETKCGVRVLGHSGIEHEIDNIAFNKKENFLFFGECKTVEVGVNHIFVFHGKMLDVGCNKGYIFTTFSPPPKEIKQFARSKNISIIDSVLDKKEKDLLKEIRIN